MDFPERITSTITLLLACSLSLLACNNASNNTSTPGSSDKTGSNPAPVVTGSFPILFVTQVPIAADFTTITATFGNHLAGMQQVGRGGDLWIRYTDGSLKNLTKAAGFGMEGEQLANAIAVRDPSIHWDAKKAIFSMVVGAPAKQYEVSEYHWQLYEISGLGSS